MSERDTEASLLARYNAVVVPEQIRTGDLNADSLLQQEENRFIDDTVASLGLGRRAVSLLMRISHGIVLPIATAQQMPFRADGTFVSHYMSEDYLTWLNLEGVQPLLSIQRSRTDSNFMVVQFSKHDLGERAIKTILQFQGEPEV